MYLDLSIQTDCRCKEGSPGTIRADQLRRAAEETGLGEREDVRAARRDGALRQHGHARARTHHTRAHAHVPRAAETQPDSW